MSLVIEQVTFYSSHSARPDPPVFTMNGKPHQDPLTEARALGYKVMSSQTVALTGGWVTVFILDKAEEAKAASEASHCYCRDECLCGNKGK